MQVFKTMEERGHEQIVYCHEDSSGLRALIAIHDTALGPALGGCRYYDYKSEADAFEDVMRLSKAMTYKAAVAGLSLGGGKAVIIGDPKKKTEALMRAFGRFVDTLGGRYITAEDVNTSVEDMEHILGETKHVVGIPITRGGSGDPSPVTGYGVWHGMKATAEHVFGSPELKGKVVAIQGLGKVGYYLAKHLVEEGARVVAADIDAERAKEIAGELKLELVSPAEILEVKCDVFAPCAMGAILTETTIPKLKCKAVAGGANNQLKEETLCKELQDRGILYAPDYVINAGGLINVYCEIDGYNVDRAMRMCNVIRKSLHTVYKISKEEGMTTAQAARVLADRRIESVRKLRRLWQ